MNEQVDAKPIHRWAIPDTWSWTVASEIAQIIGGGTPSTRDPENFDGGDIPWITPADLTGYREKMIRRGERNITEKGLRECGARVMPTGTVLFSSRAPIGYVAVADNPVATNQGFKSFIPSEAVTSDYLYYYMQFA
jgi:type I restriction enzyme S subunit